ncbi:MAG: hypothetical protein IPM63_14305 [Acidobacteriota bacterium]|nr:MAG: hypothetical protein IPM63_14305 [Acidobacteriota bacterium]
MTINTLLTAMTVILLFVSSSLASAGNMLVDGKIAMRGHSAESAKNIKTRKATKVLCLGMDIKAAKFEALMMVAGIGSREALLKELTYLESHLKGTPEGDIIENTLKRKDLTYADLYNAFDDVEKALLAKFGGEERWAFRTGLKLMDVILASVPGMEAELQENLKDLSALAEEGAEYASEEEIELLESIAGVKIGAGQNQAGFDKILTQATIFTETYMDAA